MAHPHPEGEISRALPAQPLAFFLSFSCFSRRKRSQFSFLENPLLHDTRSKSRVFFLFYFYFFQKKIAVSWVGRVVLQCTWSGEIIERGYSSNHPRGCVLYALFYIPFSLFAGVACLYGMRVLHDTSRRRLFCWSYRSLSVGCLGPPLNSLAFSPFNESPRESTSPPSPTTKPLSHAPTEITDDADPVTRNTSIDVTRETVMLLLSYQ